MPAAVLREFGNKLLVEEVRVPRPGPGHALVKLITSGACHTHPHAILGDWAVRPNPPFIPGHEGVGKVVALGEGATDREIGRLVGNAWLWSACGDFEYCRTGWETLCEKQEKGGLGHIAVQYATAMGLRVAAAHPSAFGQAIGMTRRGGTVVFNGLPPGTFPGSIVDFVVKGLTIRGSIVGTRQDLQDVLDLYARGQIHPTVSTRGLDEVNVVFDETKQGKTDGRVVVPY